ncbi:glucose dehydrogenase [Fictibacillus phosphorivorans]|uniref:Glucose dehydrogenase n=1 Tax=Fictibacillus phosphorivorans TaxID=1221500 RepID=A0A163SHT5_9BACL|nr:PQQ-dependent sugar dehydrogenase [Fictibacillus phosphorivorans]KZE69127.1 glucose dehydrogenase [Fictibacillus phosphorivorans]
MEKVKVRLRPIVSNINLPVVIKTAILPGESVETLFIATQVGEIFYVGNGRMNTFLDIRSQIIKLGVAGGKYDERGLLGLAFHPRFSYNGLFYLHYSVAGTQGPGAFSTSGDGRDALPKFFSPDPCNPETLNLKWTNRETNFDHVDTVEEWTLQSTGQPQKRRTLLNIRRPFFNHNGVNSLNFSPETGKLVLTTGDGGSGYDPFHLSQDDMEIAGKIIEMDVNQQVFTMNPPVVTRFHELPEPIQRTLSVMAKGVRNIPGISYQRSYHNQFIKYVGQVGQDLVESIFSFVHYQPIPVTQLVQAYLMNAQQHNEGFINLGWRGWEGIFPTTLINDCSTNSSIEKKTIAYYDDAIKTLVKRLQPLTSYFHEDPRPGKFSGSALTGVQSYMGNSIPQLTGSVVFTDFALEDSTPPVSGTLAYTKVRADGQFNDYSIIDTQYNYGSESSFYVSLGSNMNQTRLFLGVYGSNSVNDYNKGTVFEIVP